MSASADVNYDDETLDPPFVAAMREIVLVTGFNDDDEAGMEMLARILVRLVDKCEALANVGK